MKHFVYFLHSKSANRYYIGISVKPEERLGKHNTGYYKSSSTKIANGWELFWKLECDSKKQAILIEKHIKNMRNRSYYNNLVKYPEIAEKLLGKYSS